MPAQGSTAFPKPEFNPNLISLSEYTDFVLTEDVLDALIVTRRWILLVLKKVARK